MKYHHINFECVLPNLHLQKALLQCGIFVNVSLSINMFDCLNCWTIEASASALHTIDHLLGPPFTLISLSLSKMTHIEMWREENFLHNLSIKSLRTKIMRYAKIWEMNWINIGTSLLVIIVMIDIVSHNSHISVVIIEDEQKWCEISGLKK